MGVSLVFGGGAQGRAALHRGSMNPFAGWVAADSGMVPAPALRVVTGPTGWTAAVFDTTTDASDVHLQWTDAEHWQAEGQGWDVRRTGAQLGVVVAERHETLPIVAAPEMSEGRAEIAGHLAAAIAAYPKYRNLDPYRFRVAVTLFAVWLLQTAACLGLRRSPAWRNRRTPVQAALVVSWSAIALWLGAVYFAG